MIASAAVVAIVRRSEDRRHLVTGRAEWIWVGKEIPEERGPLIFIAIREFSWSGTPAGPARALLFVDRRHVLSVNGARLGRGEQKPGDPLAVYDVSGVLRPGSNRIQIDAESPDGAGGILFALRLPNGEEVVSDGSWRVVRSLRELLTGGLPAAVWGRPPMYPWGYPALPRPN